VAQRGRDCASSLRELPTLRGISTRECRVAAGRWPDTDETIDSQ
jgi:hypothetical protein